MLSTTKEFDHQINFTIKPRTSPLLPTTGYSEQMPSVEPDRDEPSALAPSVDGVSFEELTERHRDRCMKRALLILRNMDDAEDAVQSAFRKAFQHRDQFHGNGALAAWLGRIVENECLMRLRKQRSARRSALGNAGCLERKQKQ